MYIYVPVCVYMNVHVDITCVQDYVYMNVYSHDVVARCAHRASFFEGRSNSDCMLIVASVESDVLEY